MIVLILTRAIRFSNDRITLIFALQDHVGVVVVAPAFHLISAGSPCTM